MIKLYQFSPVWGLPNPSPFCLKLETFLRMSKIPFDVASVNNTHKAPKKKLPYIIDKDHVIPDSNFVIDYLVNKYNVSIDNELTSEQVALGTAAQRLCEESYYWVMVYSRWIEPEGWEQIQQSFFSKLPKGLSLVLPWMIRRQVKSQLFAQGYGRHSSKELYELGRRDLDTIITILGDKPYLLGQTPSSYDATVFGFLANTLWAPFESPLKIKAKQTDSVIQYCERLRTEYFPEWENTTNENIPSNGVEIKQDDTTEKQVIMS